VLVERWVFKAVSALFNAAIAASSALGRLKVKYKNNEPIAASI
jgi:hypothetical protein